MKIFVSIVSHFHHDIIINLGTIKLLQQYSNIQVVCRDNQPISKLKKYCKKYGAIYLPNQKRQGFAANNNNNFAYCQEKLGMKNKDLFLLLNPDVVMSATDITQLIVNYQEKQPKLATCNLYLDREFMVQDDNVRFYPKFINFIKTYLFNDRSTMVKRREGFFSTEKHWVSCSFMLVEAGFYSQLKGLDESYYMYCEDIDFCSRARMAGQHFTYFDEVKAVHYRRCNSKKFLSKYFFWHVCSVFTHSFRAKKIQAKKSFLISETQ